MLKLSAPIEEFQEYKRLQTLISTTRNMGWMICNNAALTEHIIEKLRKQLIPLGHIVHAAHVLEGTQNLYNYALYMTQTSRARNSVFLLNLEESLPKRYLNPNRVNQEPKYTLALSLDETWNAVLRQLGSAVILVTGEESEEIMREHAPNAYDALENYIFRFYTVEKDGELTVTATKNGNAGEWCEACQLYH